MGFNTALVVDDSKLARITLRKLLKKKNISDVTMVGSAHEAFDVLKTTKPDIIFMDHMMPDIDGFEATKQIKSNPETNHIPIIMCTGKEEANYLEQALKVGAAGMLSKPPISSDLHKVLDSTSVSANNAAAETTPDTPASKQTVAPTEATASTAASVDMKQVEQMVEEQVRQMLSGIQHSIADQVEQSLNDKLHASFSEQIDENIRAQFSEAPTSNPIDEADLIEKIDNQLSAKVTESIQSAMAEIPEPLKEADLFDKIEHLIIEKTSQSIQSAVADIPPPDTNNILQQAEEHINNIKQELTQQIETLQSAQQEVSSTPEVNLDDIADQVKEKLNVSLQERITSDIAEAMSRHSNEATQQPSVEEIADQVKQTLSTELTDFISNNTPEPPNIAEISENIKTEILDAISSTPDAADQPVAEPLPTEQMDTVLTSIAGIIDEKLGEKLEPTNQQFEEITSQIGEGGNAFNEIRNKAIKESVKATRDLLKQIQKEGDSDQVVAALAALNQKGGDKEKELLNKVASLKRNIEKFYWGTGISVLIGLTALGLAVLKHFNSI